MQAIIMAAGKGTRLQSLNASVSKHMLPIAPDKPILSHTIDILPEKIEEVILVVNHLREHIQNFFGENYNGRKIKYVIQEELNGSGGAVWACQNLIKNEFVVISGDDIYHPEDLEKMAGCNDFCILVHEPPAEEEIKAAVLELSDDDTISRIIEYPDSLMSQSRLVNTGLYKLNRNIFAYPLQKIKPGHPEFGLPQTLATLAQDFPIRTVKATFWQMVNTPEDFQKARELYPKLKKEMGK